MPKSACLNSARSMMLWIRFASVFDCACKTDAFTSSNSDSKMVVDNFFIRLCFRLPKSFELVLSSSSPPRSHQQIAQLINAYFRHAHEQVRVFQIMIGDIELVGRGTHHF